VLSGLPASALRHATLLARTTAAPRSLPPGPDVARPHLSVSSFRVTHTAVLPCLQPAPATLVRRAPPAAVGAAQSRHVRVVPVHITEPRTPPPFSPPRSVEPRTPTPPLPPLQKAPAHGHGHVSGARSPPFPASHPRRRPSHRGPHRLPITAVTVSPPHHHSENRLSTTLALFGAALTSPVLPRSSRS
jgi:hypothetical protein